MLGQTKTDKKSNEIKAIPKLLEMIHVKDYLVSVDAAGCHTKIAKMGTKLLRVLKQLYLKDNILSYTDNREPDEGNFTFLTGDKELPGLTIHVSKTMFYKDSPTYSPIMVNFFATQSSNNESYDYLLDNQSWYILESIIKKKSQKCEHLQEEVWLAIINQHPILDMADYQRVTAFIEDVLKNSMFTKIFIVDAGKAHELYHKTS